MSAGVSNDRRKSGGKCLCDPWEMRSEREERLQQVVCRTQRRGRSEDLQLGCCFLGQSGLWVPKEWLLEFGVEIKQYWREGRLEMRVYIVVGGRKKEEATVELRMRLWDWIWRTGKRGKSPVSLPASITISKF